MRWVLKNDMNKKIKIVATAAVLNAMLSGCSFDFLPADIRENLTSESHETEELMGDVASPEDEELRGKVAPVDTEDSDGFVNVDPVKE